MTKGFVKVEKTSGKAHTDWPKLFSIKWKTFGEMYDRCND